MAQPSFDSILNAVMLAESGGRRYDERGNLLTSSKGAKGEMQVLDATKFSPGFGVEPARVNTPDERARVGRDYLRAMLDRYGDVDKALAAYNWGPGNTDKWLAKGADPAKLPSETRTYIDRIKTSLAGERPMAQARQVPEAAPAVAPAAGQPRAAPVRVREARTVGLSADLGAGYQAALALSYLADEDEREGGRREYDERQPSAASQWLAQQTAKVSPEMLALSYRSPFPENKPVAMAGGGEAKSGEWKDGPPPDLPPPSLEEPVIPKLSSLRQQPRSAKDMLRQAYHSARDFVEDVPLTPLGMSVEGALLLADRSRMMPPNIRKLMDQARVERQMRRLARRQQFNDGGDVDAVASKSTERPSRPEPFRIPPGQTEARLREFNRLDPATQSLITREDPRVEFALTPAPASVSAPYTLSTMPGARALYDQTLAGTTTGGYVHPALKMRSRSGKEVAPQDVVFLRPGREQAQELQSRAHEAEHLLAKRGLGDATAINEKFDELMKDSRARRAFVEGAVGMQPYLEKTYGTKSTYFMPEMLAFQDKRGRGANLLYEQFAELAAIEQATGKDLTKDPELRKTIFKDKKVREVYNAMTGLRQTRLDARDLAPYTPIPEKSEGVMQFIRSKMGYNDGGEAKSDAPTAEELERASKPAFGVVPSSGKGRKQGRVSEALQSGEAQLAAAKGMTMLPQNIVGAPVDIATLVAQPFGYSVEKPFMGSEYLKEKTRAAGLAFEAPTDPTLRAFFTAGDIGSNLINPAGATRTAVRGLEKTGQAARMLAQAAAQDPTVARTVERVIEGVAPAATPMYAVRPRGGLPAGAPDPTLAYLVGVPSAEQSFVGRLDQHVASLKNPMQKEQFLNSLKGKFRDYDLARAADALADLGPTDKVQPVQILERLQTTYSPKSFRTRIQEPLEGQFHQHVDNVYYDKDQTSNLPLGTVSLSLDLGPKVAQQQETAEKMANFLLAVFKRPSTPVSVDDVNVFGNYLKTNLNLRPEDLKSLINSVKEAQFVGQKFRTLKSVQEDLKYPLASNNFMPTYNRYYADMQSRIQPGEVNRARDTAIEMAIKDVQKNAFTRLKSYMPSQRVDVMQNNFAFDFDYTKLAGEVKNPSALGVLNDLDLQEKAMSSYLKVAGSELINSRIGKEAVKAIEAAQAYKGQHSGLKVGDNPIGFSRFSEHTAQIPGMGEVPLMHFHELQSDLLQDVRQYGPAKGSKEADQKELKALNLKLKEAVQKADQEESKLKNLGGYMPGLWPWDTPGAPSDPIVKAQIKQVENAKVEIKKLRERRGLLADRINFSNAHAELSGLGPNPTYRLPQPFAGMETSPQVVQQLLIKNAVNAAIQRGKSGATFPGKESTQPQLYENLSNNLKQVVKDLGPGFEIRPVTLQGPKNTEYSHYGIFWGPEAAARIQKKGVPFKDGGLVERADDNRRYL